MRQIIAVTILLFILFPSLDYSQTHIFKPNGKLVRSPKELITERKTSIKNQKDIGKAEVVKNEKPLNILSVTDTLNYYRDANFSTNFGFHGQDVMMQYFIAPVDMIIKGIGFSCSDDSGAVNGADISVRLIRLNWSWQKLDSINNEMYLGFYPSADSFNNTDYFGENAIGKWQDSTKGVYPIPPWADNIDPTLNTFEYDLWSDSGKGINVTPIKQDKAGNYQWLETNAFGFEPEILAGQVFAIVIKHNGITLDEDRIGFWSSDEPGLFGWKYYENGKDDSTSPGWWTRQYTWDFAVAVDLGEGPRIFIGNITQLSTTISIEPRIVEATITSDNPTGGQAGIETAELFYSTDEGITFDTVQMVNQNDFIWSGVIPGQMPGAEVTYKIKATEVGGYSYESISITYRIFELLANELLIIFNGGKEGRAEQLTPYYLQDTGLNYDLWASYGPVEKELIKQYYAVIEIHSEDGPKFDNREALRSFVEEGSNGIKFGVIGQEALGYLVGYVDSTFKHGDYEYNILGVQRSYNDVNYDTANGIGNNSPSLVRAIENTDLGDPLFTWVTENDIDTLLYDPPEILGSGNWMDQFDPRDDINSEVFMTGYSRTEIEKPIGHNYIHSSGTEVMFMSFDPLALNTSDSIWVGYSHQNPLYQFLSRILIPSVEKINSEIPNNFSLSQNYPNPFNPTTTINYSIPSSSVISNPQRRERSQRSEIPNHTSTNSVSARDDNMQVRLSVYDILGREVATLVNQNQKPGNYKVEFNASKLTSGVYFYKLNAGEFIESKKMLLIK